MREDVLEVAVFSHSTRESFVLGKRERRGEIGHIRFPEIRIVNLLRNSLSGALLVQQTVL